MAREGKNRGMLEQASKGLLTLSLCVATVGWGIWSGAEFLIHGSRPSFRLWAIWAGIGALAWLVDDVIGDRISPEETGIGGKIAPMKTPPDTPEFARFTAAMRQIMKVSKVEMDRLIAE